MLRGSRQLLAKVIASPKLPGLDHLSTSQRFASTMTTGVFKYVDPTTYDSKPWAKVDGPGTLHKTIDVTSSLENIRGQEKKFSTDTSGFSVHHSPAHEKDFVDESTVRNDYYPEVEALLRQKLPGIKKVVLFDHTIRRRDKKSPRQPVQAVHVDQTPGAAEARVRRHLPADEVDELLKGRFQIINVWRPIGNPASDFPLAVVDWRTTSPSDFVAIDLMYPKRQARSDDQVNGTNGVHDADSNDDRGKEALPDPASRDSTEGYEIKGETFGVVPNDGHRFYYMKDMTPEEAMFIKCFDSRGQGLEKGIDGLARCTPHTAFLDPATPDSAPGRQSIEVRCLVFYE